MTADGSCRTDAASSGARSTWGRAITRNANPQQWDVATIAELAIALALAWVLGMWRMFEMPQGGSVSLEMLPIVFVAVRRGLVPGVVVGALYGGLVLIVPNGSVYLLQPLQVLLDYPLAFAALGLAGLVPVPLAGAPGVDTRRRILTFAVLLLAAVTVAALARFASHFVAGIVFWGDNAPAGQPVWLYSLLYNITYLGPEAGITWPALLLLVPALDRAGLGYRVGET
jgi:thiamine transporter